MNIPDTNVIVYKIDDEHCQVLPPVEGEPIGMSDMRLFILACLHKRSLDPSFDDEMRLWINSYSPEEFRTAVNSRAKRRMDN